MKEKFEELEKIVDCANSISDLIDKNNIKNNIDKSLYQYVWIIIINLIKNIKELNQNIFLKTKKYYSSAIK